MSAIIKVDNVSKQYRLGQVGTGSIKHDMLRWWDKLRGKEDRFLKIGETNDRTIAASGKYVWALKDISFEVQPGEVLGIIGRNGAGKSTLLKILSRVTEPSTGRIEMHGRVASLLEVGTGFHPDLTGRENIYLNGAILGMTKKEISKKFDEIVDFAGVERYIDTPVKRYSSGMHVRLGFAVAAHLEPEILIVDEVLAVGDVEFQMKCIGKMKDVSVNDGRTVLFVSHNMNAIQKLCTTGIILNKGGVEMAGGVAECIDKYISYKALQNTNTFAEISSLPACVISATFFGADNETIDKIKVGDNWNIKIIVKVNSHVNNFICAVGITDLQDFAINTTWSDPTNMAPGNYEFCFQQSFLQFAPNHYKVAIGLSISKSAFQYIEDALQFEIMPVMGLKNLNVLIPERTTGIVLNQMLVSANAI